MIELNVKDIPDGEREIELSASGGLEIVNDSASPRRRSPHQGHRGRMRARLEQEGIGSFSNERLLEYLLFGVITRADTHALAKELLDVFGSLTDVLYAPYDELMRIKGIGDNTASFLRFIALFLEKTFRVERPATYAATPEAMGAYFLPRFANETDKEAVRLMCLDSGDRVLGCVLLARGAPDRVKLSVTRILEAAANYDAPKVALCHNHTHGFAVPSGMDRASTVMAAEVLKSSEMGVKLVDHIILGDKGEFISMRDSGILSGITDDKS